MWRQSWEAGCPPSGVNSGVDRGSPQEVCLLSWRLSCGPDPPPTEARLLRARLTCGSDSGSLPPLDQIRGKEQVSVLVCMHGGACYKAIKLGLPLHHDLNVPNLFYCVSIKVLGVKLRCRQRLIQVEGRGHTTLQESSLKMRFKGIWNTGCIMYPYRIFPLFYRFFPQNLPYFSANTPKYLRIF